MLIFVIPSSIVRYSKEIDTKMDLYDYAIRNAEELVSKPSNSIELGTFSFVPEFINGATYTGGYEILEMTLSATIQNINGTTDRIKFFKTDSYPFNETSIKYASVTCKDADGNSSVSFHVIPKN